MISRGLLQIWVERWCIYDSSRSYIMVTDVLICVLTSLEVYGGKKLVENKPKLAHFPWKSRKRNFGASQIVLRRSQWAYIFIYDGNWHYSMLLISVGVSGGVLGKYLVKYKSKITDFALDPENTVLRHPHWLCKVIFDQN